MTNVNRAQKFLKFMAISAEELATKVKAAGDVSDEDMATYDTIQEVVGDSVGMVPLDDLDTVDEVVSELEKVGEVAQGADPEETAGEVTVGELEDQDEDPDTVDSEVIIAAAVGALEALQTEVISAGAAGDYHVNRYESIGKVFFNGTDVQPEVNEPSTLLVAVESWIADIKEDYNISAESFGKLLSQ